jgi:hypothetical protein
MKLIEQSIEELISNCEDFRRRVGPGWQSLAKDLSDRLVDGLGIKLLEASQVFPAHYGREADEHVEKSLFAAMGKEIASASWSAVEVTRGKANQCLGTSSMTVRAYVITGDITE